MVIVIHAVPERLWYVENHLIPALEAQGAENIRIWNDLEHRGNLRACMECFAAMDGEGGAWHIQDDVLPAADFVQRCTALDSGVVWGFCCEYFLDDPEQAGFVYPEDAWHSFQCVRIPNDYARACAAWFFADGWRDLDDPELELLYEDGRGDDSFFRRWLQQARPAEAVYNVRPCLVEHVDLLIGGSVIPRNQWRDYPARAHWFDGDLTAQLQRRLRERRTI